METSSAFFIDLFAFIFIAVPVTAGAVAIIINLIDDLKRKKYNY